MEVDVVDHVPYMIGTNNEVDDVNVDVIEQFDHALVELLYREAESEIEVEIVDRAPYTIGSNDEVDVVNVDVIEPMHATPIEPIDPTFIEPLNRQSYRLFIGIDTNNGCDKNQMFVPTSDQGRKKYCCYYCKKPVSKLVPHLENFHKKEKDVKAFKSLPTGGNASWCAPFSVAHHLYFEYWLDLLHFYFSGYGVRNQRMLDNLSCGVKQDLLIHMLSDDSTDQMARIFVTNTQVIQSMLVSLGAFRDGFPPHQHNYFFQSGRQWASTLIAPHGQNLVVVRYDCDDGDHDLYFLLNERPLLVPGCDQETGLCKLSFIVDRFQRFINANCEASFCTDD